MKLNKLIVRGLRGFSEEQTIDLNGDLVMRVSRPLVKPEFVRLLGATVQKAFDRELDCHAIPRNDSNRIHVLSSVQSSGWGTI
jgi:hypothetical protein